MTDNDNDAPRDDAAAVTAELLDWIEATVRHLVACADGLTDAQLRTPVTTSGWTVLGLLDHVRDSTVFWLEHVVVGSAAELDEDKPWDNDPAASAQDVIARVESDVARACAAARGTPHDAAPGWWPEGAWGGYRQDSVRGVLLHLLKDNAAHSGQLDVVREGIDGAVWDFAIGGVRRP